MCTSFSAHCPLSHTHACCCSGPGGYGEEAAEDGEAENYEGPGGRNYEGEAPLLLL